MEFQDICSWCQIVNYAIKLDKHKTLKTIKRGETDYFAILSNIITSYEIIFFEIKKNLEAFIYSTCMELCNISWWLDLGSSPSSVEELELKPA